MISLAAVGCKAMLGTNLLKLPGLNAPECAENSRDERQQVLNAIRFGDDDDQDDSE